jgi:thiamine biosynthesis lipoprotein
MPSRSQIIERAKPLLGTTVTIRVHGLAPARARDAIGAGFAAVAEVHAAMSFHETESDVSRLNRAAHLGPVAVGAGTYAVIARALAVSALTDGAFDITVAPLVVARGHLPRPAHAPEPDGAAIWHDVALLPETRIRFRRPLWVDLGGIAKGFAVDRAMEAVLSFAPKQVCVNAGGDLAIAGPETERVHLAAGLGEDADVAMMELSDGSLASSESTDRGAHIDPRRRTRGSRQFVSVAAPRCIDADALTKVVLARGACSAKALAAFGAHAVVHDTAFGWREIRGHA